ncbi:MAG: SMP-30/gluconolactonase/LRE family protein [Solirubrobacterales bacterium]
MLVPSAAAAAPACPNAPQAQTLYSGYGALESVIVDPQGRLYFTDTANNRVLRATNPGDQSSVVPWATGIPEPGGMVFDPATGDLLVGSGDSILTGQMANPPTNNPQASVVRVDKDTGTVTPYASGLKMANGLAITGNGTLFASSDVAPTNGIDRVGPGGAPVEPGLANVASANGLVVDSAEQWLYAAQTFVPAAIQRVSISDPSQVETFVAAPAADLAAALDGMVRDENDQLYVAANGGGQIWKVTNPGRQICSLASMDPLGPSAVAFGKGATGFSAANLYVVTFGGDVIEISNARGAVTPGPAGSSPGAIYSERKAKRKCKKRHRKKAHHSKKRKRCKRKKHHRK